MARHRLPKRLKRARALTLNSPLGPSSLRPFHKPLRSRGWRQSHFYEMKALAYGHVAHGMLPWRNIQPLRLIDTECANRLVECDSVGDPISHRLLCGDSHDPTVPAPQLIDSRIGAFVELREQHVVAPFERVMQLCLPAKVEHKIDCSQKGCRQRQPLIPGRLISKARFEDGCCTGCSGEHDQEHQSSMPELEVAQSGRVIEGIAQGGKAQLMPRFYRLLQPFAGRGGVGIGGVGAGPVVTRGLGAIASGCGVGAGPAVFVAKLGIAAGPAVEISRFHESFPIRAVPLVASKRVVRAAACQRGRTNLARCQHRRESIGRSCMSVRLLCLDVASAPSFICRSS